MINNKTEKSMMYDYLICLAALIFMSIYYYGWRAIIVTGISAITCYLVDIFCIYQRKKEIAFSDFSGILIGITFAMLLPASIPYNILIISCIIMVIIGKQAFGGNENIIFNTVAVGYAFASLCWKEAMLWFPVPNPMGQIDLSSNVPDLVHSFTYNIDIASMPSISEFDMVLGRFAGPMGTTHIIVLLVCAIVLLCRRSISFTTFTSCLGTLLASAFFFPQAIRETRISSVLFEIMGGATLFVLIFIACDKRNSPKTRFGRLLYGIIVAILTILFRRYANIEVGMIFAVIISNVLCEALDNNSANLSKIIRKLFAYVKLLLKKLIKMLLSFFNKLLITIKTAILKLKNKIFSSHNSEGETKKVIAEKALLKSKVEKKSITKPINNQKTIHNKGISRKSKKRKSKRRRK